MTIFAEHAPAYWAAGIPVIPLKRWNSSSQGAGKAPIIAEWTKYGETMPIESVQQLWIKSYSHSNIGLPFGEASGMCAIDIDTEDDDLIAAIRGALPESPWVRVGKKGMGLMYRWSGQPNFKLRDSDNKSIVEFLGKGNQMVLPPSVHPETERPYTANNNLVDVKSQLPALPLDLEEVLRAALEPVVGKLGKSLAQAGRSSPLRVVPAGERDIQLVRHAGYLARVVLGIDKTEKLSLVGAMEHMHTWVAQFTEDKAGDDMDPEKGVAKLLEFLLKDVHAGKTLPDGWDDGLTEAHREDPVIKDLLETNEVKRWSFTKGIAALNERVAVEPGNPDFAYKEIVKLIGEMAADDNFEESQLKFMHPHFERAMGENFKINKSDLIGMLRDARTGETDADADHEAIARRVYDILARDGEIVFENGSFWQWEGACFKLKDPEDIKKIVAQDIKGNILSRRHNDYVAVAKTLELVARGKLVKNAQPGVNFANGYLDTGLELRDHSKDYGCTYVMDFDYVPEKAAEAHKWLAFLEDCWGDDEDYFDKVAALQEAFAATMFGQATQYQTAILLYGRAGAAKTQVLEVLSAMLPEASRSSVSPELWGVRFQDTPMVGKILNVCGEMSESSVIDGKAFKTVVEGGLMTTEHKGMSLFEYRPVAAQWFAGNFLPRTRDTSEGFTRRWLIFEFKRVVPPEQRIPDFYKILVAEEREAIAAWAMEGWHRLVEQRGYTRPASSKRLVNMVRRSNNSVIAFMQSSDKVVAQDGAEADLRALFDQYVMYMKDISRGWSVTFERFKQMVEEAGYDLEEYEDGVGTRRECVKGVKLLQAILPSKG